MYEKPNWVVIVFAELIILLKALTLGYLMGQGIYDPSFFTYFSYTLLYAFYLVALFSYTSPRSMQFVYSFFFIPMFGITSFVAFAIVVIVQCNDWVYLRTTILGGTTRAIGDVHTGDFVLHYLPLIGFLLYAALHSRYIGLSIHNLWHTLRTGEKMAYVFYLSLAPLLVLGFYMTVMPFDKNYPTMLSNWLIAVLVSVLSLSIQAIIILVVFYVFQAQDFDHHKLVTPTGHTAWNRKD